MTIDPYNQLLFPLLSLSTFLAPPWFLDNSQQRSLVVVCSLAVQRCLYAYFMGIEVSEVPYIDLPQHQLTELIPSPFGTGYRHISETEMMHHF